MVQKITTCTGHKAAIYDLAQGKDARHFLTAGGDGWVTEWNLDNPETGRVVAAVESQVFSLCALPDPNQLIAGNMTGGLHWIDRSNPAQTKNIQNHRNKGVYGIKYHEKQVFSIGGDGVLTRWNTESRTTIESIQLSNQALRAIDICPIRREIAIGSSDCSIYILSLDDLGIQRTIEKAHANSVFSLAYSANGTILLSGGRDAMLHTWLPNEGFKLQEKQPAHLYTINDIKFSPDQTYFATASRDRTIKIWDAHTMKLLKVINTLKNGSHINSVNRLLWTADFLISVSDDRTAMIWKANA